MRAEPYSWQAAPFELTYWLGEMALFRKRFRGLVLREHYLELGDDPDVPAPPFERFGNEVDVIVTRSHPLASPIPTYSVRDGVLRYVLARYTRFHTDLTGDFEGYLGKFSGKTRSTLRRKVRKFLELGEGCGMREYTRPEEMDEFVRQARRISILTYQEKFFDAGIPGDAEFLAEMRSLSAEQSVRAYLLLLRGEPIAYLCCPATKGVLSYRYLGYDPVHAELSPGTVLQYLAFESLFAEKRFAIFDFTEGQGEHKRFFGTHETPCADICYFPANLHSRFWVGLHRAFDAFSIGAAGFLDRLGLKTRLKRFLRRL